MKKLKKYEINIKSGDKEVHEVAKEVFATLLDMAKAQDTEEYT